MIRVAFRTHLGTVTIEGASVKEVFRDLAIARGVFGAQEECGLCHSEFISPRVRHLDGNDFYDLLCGACGASFNFGQHRVGDTLFPKYADGWKRYGAAAKQGGGE